jgi:hypothetical protein
MGRRYRYIDIHKDIDIDIDIDTLIFNLSTRRQRVAKFISKPLGEIN